MSAVPVHLRFPREAREPPRANALWGLTSASSSRRSLGGPGLLPGEIKLGSLFI